MSRSYPIILGPVTGEIGSLRVERRALVPHKSTSARTVPHLTSRHPAALLLSRASRPGRPGLTATMPHRGGQDRNDVTLWRLRQIAFGDW
jgi:hypothetical protein